MASAALLTIALLAISASATAASGSQSSAQIIDRVTERCEDVSIQAETLGCFLAAAATSRAEMQQTYRRNLRSAMFLERKYNSFIKSQTNLKSVLPRSTLVRQLQASQKAWLMYSRAECGFQGETFFGGSGQDITDAECQFHLNLKRVDELNAAYKLLNM
jgi:uncharacterized protein YecT (DUF1311 family)